MAKNNKENSESRDGTEKRLDALIRLFIELNRSDPNKKFTEADAARTLKSVDLTPTEIAKILGKKSATDVAPYLYSKKKNTKWGKIWFLCLQIRKNS